MAKTIKSEFGKLFREARDAKKLSRAALGLRLGISPKTIQSWEMGRTFIEKLSLIPAIESELNISISGLIAAATKIIAPDSIAAESPAAYTPRKPAGRTQAGPLTANFEIGALDVAKLPKNKDLKEEFVAIPILKPQSLKKEVSLLTNKDIAGHTIVPSEWMPRGGVIVAFRMADSGMAPMIPLGATVVIDRRPYVPEKCIGRVMALNFTAKGMRVRKIEQDVMSGKFYGVTVIPNKRNRMEFGKADEDSILGRVVGVLAKPEE